MLTKEELELLLKAFKMLREHDFNERQSISSIEQEIKEMYIKVVTDEL